MHQLLCNVLKLSSQNIYQNISVKVPEIEPGIAPCLVTLTIPKSMRQTAKARAPEPHKIQMNQKFHFTELSVVILRSEVYRQ